MACGPHGLYIPHPIRDLPTSPAQGWAATPDNLPAEPLTSSSGAKLSQPVFPSPVLSSVSGTVSLTRWAAWGALPTPDVVIP